MSGLSATDTISLNAGTSPASASTAVVTGVSSFKNFDAITFIATIRGATGGTLDVYVQHSQDGTNWYDYIHFPQLTAAAAAVTYHYSPALNDVLTVIGSGTTPALAAGTCAGGHPFEYLRVLYVAGASTSAGAAQSISVMAVRNGK